MYRHRTAAALAVALALVATPALAQEAEADPADKELPEGDGDSESDSGSDSDSESDSESGSGSDSESESDSESDSESESESDPDSDDDDEEDEDDEDDEDDTPLPPPPPSMDPATREWLEALVEKRVQERLDEGVEEKLEEAQDSGMFGVELPEVRFEWRGDFFTKMLVRNNQSGGCVTYGNPAPEGDNFSGDNGICSELGLTARGIVSDYVEAGARIQSRFGASWADYWENGDLKSALDGSGESLGMNHASYLQLRGIYLRVAPPIPTLQYVHFGASDLSMFNPWTVGKLRFTERDNGRGIFVGGSFGDWLSYTGARIALPKLWASANYNTGIDDALIQNPFWERDAAWALKLKSEWEWFELEQVTSWILDEEADLDDPDAVGSTNRIDERDGVVITNPRYQNVNATFEASSDWLDWLAVSALGGFSWSKTDERLVFNAVAGSQGFTPVPMGEHFGYAVVVRNEIVDPLDIDLNLSLEYFNIGSEWVSVMGARREADLLLTDGFVDGQVATLNVANEFQDFSEPFYEPIVGWHGGTALLEWVPGALELGLEGTFIEYNTDTGEAGRDTDKVYPDFLYTDGMTDTEFFSFANTNDRGRDPRSVYKAHQNRRTVIGVLKGSYTLDFWRGITFRGKHKTIWDTDLRDPNIREDDNYNGILLFNRASVESSITDELSFALGYQFDYWDETNRSGDVIAGVADYPDYVTIRQKAFVDLRYVFAGMNLWYHLEYLNKDVDTSKDELDYRFRHVVRSVAMVSASF
jgi:hypothetical protein